MLRSPRAIALFLLGLFVILVALGVTGSSFDNLPRHTSGLVSTDSKVVAGSARLIRPDEWTVLTPMAISQRNHQPPFPIVNQNHGLDGHNMLVVGMVGVPVAHVSALAKPAGWGFFVFDLKRALAWQWWAPIFGCLFALWGVMRLLLPTHWMIGLAASVAFLTSAYVSAWSNWPAYAVFFPAAGMCLAHRLLFARRWWACGLLGLLLGLCLAGFVLILYPPWQIPLGCLFLAVAGGLIWRDRLWTQLSALRTAGFVLAATAAALIVYAWWRDAAPAIQALQATVYPGERVSLSGGGIPLWQFVEGFLNHYTLYFEGAPGINPSESSSFLYFFPVAVLWLLADAVRTRRAAPVELLLALFCLWVVAFQLIGVPPALAKWTLWGRVPDYRADLSLGLASMMICALVLARPGSQGGAMRRQGLVVTAAWALVVAIGVASTPAPSAGKIPAYLLIAAPLAAFTLSYWLWCRNTKAFFIGLLVLTCSASLPFNPVALAPGSVLAKGAVMPSTELGHERVLTVGRQIDAMALLASGVPVVNGVFYYPPRALWESLDPNGEHLRITNRFQHLIFLPEALDDLSAYRIETPQDDVVIVRFDPLRFDFGLTKATLVVALPGYDLAGNSTLAAVGEQGGYRVYRVQGTTPSPQ